MPKVSLVFEDHVDNEGQAVFSMRLDTDNEDESEDSALTLAEQMGMIAHDSMLSFINGGDTIDEVDPESVQLEGE